MTFLLKKVSIDPFLCLKTDIFRNFVLKMWNLLIRRQL